MLPDADAFIREALDDASREALRAGDIGHRLRDFVAHGEGGRNLENLPALIGEAVALGAIGARGGGVEVRTDLDPAARLVLVDKVQTQQVLINLIRNAMEAMSGSPVRQLVISSRIQDRQFVRVSVEDSGPDRTSTRLNSSH